MMYLFVCPEYLPSSPLTLPVAFATFVFHGTSRGASPLLKNLRDITGSSSSPPPCSRSKSYATTHTETNSGVLVPLHSDFLETSYSLDCLVVYVSSFTVFFLMSRIEFTRLLNIQPGLGLIISDGLLNVMLMHTLLHQSFGFPSSSRITGVENALNVRIVSLYASGVP